MIKWWQRNKWAIRKHIVIWVWVAGGMISAWLGGHGLFDIGGAESWQADSWIKAGVGMLGLAIVYGFAVLGLDRVVTMIIEREERSIE